jgi:TPP-dependent 2-oxoacid decarboxylase
MSDGFTVGDYLLTRLAETGIRHVFGVPGDYNLEVADLVADGQIPHATLSMGKSLLDEGDPGFVGVYCGSASDKRVLEAVEGADVTITVGVRFSDITTNGFSQQIDPARTIDVQPFSAWIGGRAFGPLPMRDAVTALAGVVRKLGQSWARPELALVVEDSVPADSTHEDAQGSAPLTHAQLWPTMERFLRPGDIVLSDQGTAFCGAQFMRLPAGVTFIGQPLWASIGYALPATLGAQLAAPARRVVLLIGDGAMQLTVQELGTLVRQGCAPVIVLLNNDGYTIERAIFGAEQSYNDIAGWNWTLLAAAMGGESALTAQVSTGNELTEALNAVAGADGRLMLIDSRLPKLDVPEFLATFARIAAAASVPSKAA